MSINPKRFEPPSLVEPLNYETIYQQILNDFLARDPNYTALVETDPALILIQAIAYRELNLRQRINDAARGVMLAYAVDDDLDSLAGLLKITRQNGENDETLRQRVVDSIEVHTTAGSLGSYYYHVMNTNTVLGGVRDTHITRSAPGTVSITILANEGSGMPDATMLTDVKNTLSAETVRPLTDNVVVLEPTFVYDYTLTVVLYLFDQLESEIIPGQAEETLLKYIEENRKLGRDITQSGLYAAIHQPCVEHAEFVLRVNGEIWEGNINVGDTEFAYCSDYSIVVGEL